MKQKVGVFRFGGQQKGQGRYQRFSRCHLEGVVIEYISEIHEESKGSILVKENYIYGYIKNFLNNFFCIGEYYQTFNE